MPRMANHIYAAHMDNVLKLAATDGGVSRPELMDKLNVSRTIANKLVDMCGLKVGHTEGRTEYLVPGETKADDLPPEVVEAALVDQEPDPVDTTNTPEALDAAIAEAKKALHDATEKAAKAMRSWITHDAMIDALRDRIRQLAAAKLESMTDK